jgi:DNA-binding HxlR family transcriptional regulator
MGLSIVLAVAHAGLSSPGRRRGFRRAAGGRGEFLASEERITTSVLADRLATLVQTGILAKRRSATDRRKESYSLTEKGRALIPVLVELANWGVGYDPDVAANPFWVGKAHTDRAGLYRIIHETVLAGGSVFRGENSVISQLERAAAPARPAPFTRTPNQQL